MTLSDNNAVQLWRKAEADTRDAVNLMLSPIQDHDALMELLPKIRQKLNHSLQCVQQLERMAQFEARQNQSETHHPLCECERCK